MTEILITAEFTSVAFLLLVILGLVLQSGNRTTASRLLLASVIAVAVGTSIDALSYLLDYSGASDGVMFTVNLLAFIGCDLAMIPFIYYAWMIIREERPLSIWFAHGTAIACGVDLVWCVVSSLAGWMFTIEGGAFTPGPVFVYNGALQIVAMLFFFVVILTGARKTGAQIVCTIGLYFTLPVVAVVACLYWDLPSFVYVMVALIVTFVYVNLQSGEIVKGRSREKLMYEVLHKDAMTHLNNRLSYDKALKEVAPDAAVGVVFCDLNGLKATNDQYGHAAGDALITEFAGMLRKFFSEDETYRISGDEFVVLRINMSEEKFMADVERLKAKNEDLGEIGAIGHAYGIGEDVFATVNEAEKTMYDVKADYYQRAGIDRRKN